VTGLTYESEMTQLAKGCGHLAGCGILVQSAGFTDASSFYTQVQRVAAEFDVTRVLAHDGLLKNGKRLSQSPIPPGWQDVSSFLGVEVVLCGRRNPGAKEQSKPADPAIRGTVLIVDDVKEVRACLKLLLNHWGLRVLEAGTSEEALRVTGGVCVDLMLSDINRPGMNGIDFLPVFKQLHPNTPVIIVSACLDDHVRIKASRAGAAALLAKPFQLADLRSVIRQTGLSVDQD
jgi:CheY-like chemotaxis protein